MNNAFVGLGEESIPDKDERLQAEEAKLVRIIEAIQAVQTTKYWSTLKTEVFEPLAEVLERNLKEEARREDPSPSRLNRIAGEMKWAARFSDLSKLENEYRVKLQNVRLRIHGKTN